MTMKKIIFLLGLVLIASSCRYTKDAKDTAYNEFKVSSLLKKYEYFKDMSAQLDKKVSDITVFEGKMKRLKEDYQGKTRVEWTKEDREQYSLWEDELSGIKSSYNSLASEYNSAMSKFNYAFCNYGQLPKGAEKPLPREFKSYITE